MKRVFCSWMMIMMLAAEPVLFAKEQTPLYPGFPPIRESKAYKKFSTRTYSEFSKILYLIDRFSDSKIAINYDDQTYTAAFATTVARWFLSRNYKKQTAREWVKQWCNKSILMSKPIYVKLPDGQFRLSREVLMEEIENLEQVVRENQNPPAVSAAPSVSAPASAAAPPASEVVVSTALQAPQAVPAVKAEEPALAQKA